ncbi:MAG: inorganic phosphate transporter [Chitinophagales bacterium]|nr:inorganic phosphate transporter [Bacteroidota bacterium]MBX7141641.1 inorganic phosphate transporter [Chitinophagales bacterium]
MYILLIVVVALALIFDIINGFHDAANSIATIVSTKVLSPLLAVAWAAFFNFIAFLVFGLHVANTIGKGIVNPDVVTLPVVLSGLVAAITWNLLTWYYGIPSSSSHTLVGGFAGAAIAKSGFGAVYSTELFRIISFIFLAPVIGLIVAFFISVLTMHICRNFIPHKVDNVFRRLQLVSAAAYSLGHGANDAQKAMGIIFASLIAAGQAAKTDSIPFWVVISCQAAMAIGTLMGGWRIVKTMGQRITNLTPFEGFSAETAGAITLFSTAQLGIPVSTTHTITGSIIGVGMKRRVSAVRWGVTRKLLWAWIITIPVSMVMAIGIYYLTAWAGL